MSDATDLAIEEDETLEQARQCFNERYPSAGGILNTVALPRMFIPGAPFLARLADVGVNSCLLQPEPQGLVAMVQRYPDMRVGDLLEMFWHAPGLEAKPLCAVYVEAGQLGSDVPVYLPSEQAVEGIADLYCRVTRQGAEVGRSTPLSVLCKPSLPGGPDPSPETAWHGGLGAPTLVSPIIADASAWVEVPPWLYMQAGGMLQLAWGDQLVEYRFTDEEVGQPLRIEVPARLIGDAGNSARLPVRYRIIDVVGDTSEKWSAITWVSVLLQPGLGDAPRVHGATEVQHVDATTNPVQVLVWASWQQMAASDEVELLAGGVDFAARPFTLSSRRVIEEVGKGYLFELPGSWLAQLAGGMLSLSYRVRRNGQVVARSCTRYLEVSGAKAELPYADPSADSDGRLDPVQSGQAVTVRYPGLAYGDRVKLCWHGLTARRQPYVWEMARSVSRADAGRGQLVFLVAAEHVQALDQGSLQLCYSVARPGPSAPLMSPRLWLQVGELPVELPAPQVAGVDSEGDLRVSAGQTAKVTLPDYPGRRDDDLVTVSWLGANAASSIRLSGNGLEWSIPAQVLLAGMERPSEVHYRVTRHTDQQVRLSSSIRLTVTAGVPLQLGAPQVMEALSDGGLDPSRVPPQGVTVLFQDQAIGLRPGDQVVLQVAGKGSYASEPILYDPDQPQHFLVPARLITESLGGALTFAYRITRGERDKGRSVAATFPVRHRLSVSSSLLTLNGLSVKYPAWRRVGPDSNGNTAVRAATGGKPPYSYASSKPSVASVDSNGKVTGNGNGGATITVTDSQRTCVSYEVQVSNVWTLNLRGDRNWRWPQAVAWMNTLKGRPATTEFIADLQRVYGAPLPVERYLWNCRQVNKDAGEFYHHSYAFSCYFCIANTPNTNIFGGMCVTPRNG
ncbi:Ig-like domain-containing protein [Pseudomonas sp. MWU13-3659]|uniref:Ig-like domain-containing protein n=1 Tax=Pseudomonas sp. MWU13-3659 TaxID=2986964 RepID=UPI002074C840|nr:Ig-like domain-containing protein [Pseudomonas sp. MWU13-3659]